MGEGTQESRQWHVIAQIQEAQGDARERMARIETSLVSLVGDHAETRKQHQTQALVLSQIAADLKTLSGSSDDQRRTIVTLTHGLADEHRLLKERVSHIEADVAPIVLRERETNKANVWIDRLKTAGLAAVLLGGGYGVYKAANQDAQQPPAVTAPKDAK